MDIHTTRATRATKKAEQSILIGAYDPFVSIRVMRQFTVEYLEDLRYEVEAEVVELKAARDLARRLGREDEAIDYIRQYRSLATRRAAITREISKR